MYVCFAIQGILLFFVQKARITRLERFWCIQFVKKHPVYQATEVLPSLLLAMLKLRGPTDSTERVCIIIFLLVLDS